MFTMAQGLASPLSTGKCWKGDPTEIKVSWDMFIVLLITKGVQQTFAKWWNKLSCKNEFLSEKFEIPDVHIQPSYINIS